MIGVEDLQQQGRPERERNTAFRTVARIYIRCQFELWDQIIVFRNCDIHGIWARIYIRRKGSISVENDIS